MSYPKTVIIRETIDGVRHTLDANQWSEFMAKRGVEISAITIRNRYKRRKAHAYTNKMILGIDPLPGHRTKEVSLDKQKIINNLLRTGLKAGH